MIQFPLVPIAIAFASGIALAPHVYLSLKEQLAALLVCLALSTLLACFRKSWPALIVAWIGLGLCGTILSEFDRMPPPDTHLESRVKDGDIDITRPMKISGWVQSPSEARPGSYIFDLASEQVDQSGGPIPTQGTIRVYYFTKAHEVTPFRLPYGTRVELATQNLRVPRNYGNPGMFDYSSTMKRQGISFTALLSDRSTDLHLVPGYSGNTFKAFIYRVREAMLGSIERMLPQRPITQSILKAMLLGDDNWLQDDTEEAFQKSGTYHVLVISGWNVAVFAGPLLLILTRFRMANWLSSLIVLISVASFALIAQSEIPIVRASSMFMVYLAARYYFRRRALLNSLAASAILLLLIHPSDLFDWGFQLSFLAVLTLAGIALPAAEWKITPYRHALRDLHDSNADLHYRPGQAQVRSDLRTLFQNVANRFTNDAHRQQLMMHWIRSASWLFVVVAEALFFTATMQMGYSLVTAEYFHRLTWSGILGNLLILPIASCIVLCGMVLIPIELLLPLLGPLAGKALAPALEWLCNALLAIARFAAGMSGLNFRVPSPPVWLTFAFVLSAVVLAALIARRSRWSMVAATMLVICCLALSKTPNAASCTAGNLEVTAMDVGQGDALLVCFPKGHTMLVDAGGTIPIPGSPVRRQDIGETVVSPYLWERGISRLDYVVLSHDHFDHMGGLEAVFENFPVGEFWMGPDAEEKSMDWLRTKAADAGANVVWPVRAGEAHSIRMIDGVQVEVLSPPGAWAPKRVSNNDSIVLRLTYRKRKFLLAGDIESRMEHILVSGKIPLRSDVLKVAHHGSRTSTTPEFLQAVEPAFSLVSVGPYKRFGHPNAEVIERLSADHKMVSLIPLAGATTIATDGNRITVDRYQDHIQAWPIDLTAQ